MEGSLPRRLTRPGALTAYRAATDLVAKGAFLLLTVFAARRLSRDDFGLFALGSAMGWLAGVVSDAGLQMHVARTIARGGPQSAGAIVQRWLTWRGAMAACALGGAGLLMLAWRMDGRIALALLLLVATWLCGALTEFFNHVFRGLSRTDIESTIAAASRIATLIAGAAVLAWQPDLVTFASTLFITALLTLVVTARRSAGLTHNRIAAPRQAGRWTEFVDEVLPIGAGVVLSALYFRIDAILLERWQDAAAVGAYTAVFRLVEALRLFPAAALAVALPALCTASTTQTMTKLAVRWTAAAVAASLALWMTAGWLVPFLYGNRFADAVPVFRVLLIGFPLMTLNYALTTQLVAWDRHRFYAALCGGALVVNVAVNARLIPAISATGAAWATVWTEVFLTFGCVCALATARERPLSEVPGVAS